MSAALNVEESDMDRTRVPSGLERKLGAVTARLVAGGAGLPAFQTRICAHCGQRAAFALQDQAGWYSCTACGRYA